MAGRKNLPPSVFNTASGGFVGPASPVREPAQMLRYVEFEKLELRKYEEEWSK